MDGEPHHRGRMAEKLAQRRAEHAKRGRVYRVAFAAAGTVVTLAGLAMLVTPGPALVVIPIGLAMLAMEFAWAERALERALDQAEGAQQRARETSRLRRVLGGVAIVLGIAAFATAAVLWDIPLVPLV